ncbi:MAG: hypothetical protein J5858_05065, partial [Lentisphaeria bacterium]|nr:hypothetical protein [Lentisphaeria bacterium]
MTTENKPHSPHKPHSLESLVPPLDLCRKIPKGDFGYSALTWNEGYVKGNFVYDFIKSVTVKPGLLPQIDECW